MGGLLCTHWIFFEVGWGGNQVPQVLQPIHCQTTAIIKLITDSMFVKLAKILLTYLLSILMIYGFVLNYNKNDVHFDR